MQAAKALKNVAMHDARGMRKAVHGEHDGDDEEGGMGWNLSGAHEAKVPDRSQESQRYIC